METPWRAAGRRYAGGGNPRAESSAGISGGSRRQRWTRGTRHHGQNTWAGRKSSSRWHRLPRRITARLAASGCQLIAIGDHRQCQAIEAAPTIELLRKALGPDQVPELLITVRQQSERERQTSLLFRDGEAGAALARKDEEGTLELVPGGYRDAVRRVTELWAEQQHAADASCRLNVTAPTNEDARAISAAIRERRRSAGDLGPDRITLPPTDQNGTEYDLALARGDRVRCSPTPRARRRPGR
jgi:hypothetical protein